MQFQPGDIVELKSGGPLMTVRAVHHDSVTCTWFKGDKSFNEAFPNVILKKHQPSGPSVELI